MNASRPSPRKPSPERLFKDSWRPEDKAMESAEEEVLERKFPGQIQAQRAERHKQTPALRGFERLGRESGDV